MAAAHRPYCLAPTLCGLMLLALPVPLAAQQQQRSSLTPRTASSLPSETLRKAQMVVEVPRRMRLQASTVVRLSIWDQRGGAQARAILGTKAPPASDVEVSQLVRADLVSALSSNFAIHAMRPTEQAIPPAGVAVWEWTVIPLQPGVHQLSLLATHRADSLSSSSNLPLPSASVQVEVEPGSLQRPEAAPTAPAPHALPFAAYVLLMHRRIHPRWADGFLASLDSQRAFAGPGVAFPATLATAIDIAVRGDGSLDSAVVVRSSGSVTFDAAALAAVIGAAPFPSPPDSIRSRDGNVYLTWPLHRDDRQCHTSFVDMHILTTLPGRGGMPPRSTAPAQASVTTGSADHRARSSAPEGAQQIVARWLAAFQQGDVRWLSGASGLPFFAGGRVVADSAAELHAFYAELLRGPALREHRLELFSRAEVETKLGRIPAGGDEPDMWFALIHGRGDDFILLIAPTDRGWSVVGMTR